MIDVSDDGHVADVPLVVHERSKLLDRESAGYTRSALGPCRILILSSTACRTGLAPLSCLGVSTYCTILAVFVDYVPGKTFLLIASRRRIAPLSSARSHRVCIVELPAWNGCQMCDGDGEHVRCGVPCEGVLVVGANEGRWRRRRRRQIMNSQRWAVSPLPHFWVRQDHAAGAGRCGVRSHSSTSPPPHSHPRHPRRPLSLQHVTNMSFQNCCESLLSHRLGTDGTLKLDAHQSSELCEGGFEKDPGLLTAE